MKTLAALIVLAFAGLALRATCIGAEARTEIRMAPGVSVSVPAKPGEWIKMTDKLADGTWMAMGCGSLSDAAMERANLNLNYHVGRLRVILLTPQALAPGTTASVQWDDGPAIENKLEFLDAKALSASDAAAFLAKLMASKKLTVRIEARGTPPRSWVWNITDSPNIFKPLIELMKSESRPEAALQRGR